MAVVSIMQYLIFKRKVPVMFHINTPISMKGGVAERVLSLQRIEVVITVGLHACAKQTFHSTEIGTYVHSVHIFFYQELCQKFFPTPVVLVKVCS